MRKWHFVIGLDHPNYKQNREQSAQRMKDEMEKLVPGITRNIISKGGAGVDGKYNQDLHPSVILIELGGIGNSEDELNRTIVVIAEACMLKLLSESNNVEILNNVLFTAIIIIAEIGVNRMNLEQKLARQKNITKLFNHRTYRSWEINVSRSNIRKNKYIDIKRNENTNIRFNGFRT